MFLKFSFLKINTYHLLKLKLFSKLKKKPAIKTGFLEVAGEGFEPPTFGL